MDNETEAPDLLQEMQAVLDHADQVLDELEAAIKRHVEEDAANG